MVQEIKQNLFTVPSKYYLAHCISSDFALGAGIAADFEKVFGLRSRLPKEEKGIYPNCIRIGKVFNLVTKNNYWDKPTLETVRMSLTMMKDIMIKEGIAYIAMPLIGCGLDRLKWKDVKYIIYEVFHDTNIEILICKL